MESAKLIAGNQDKLTKSVFINIIDTDFFNERLCGMVNSSIWICEEAVCGDEREHEAAFE